MLFEKTNAGIFEEKFQSVVSFFSGLIHVIFCFILLVKLLSGRMI